MRVLVTGGSGMLGGHTARALARRGHEVHTVDRHERAPREVHATHVAELSTPGAFAAVITSVEPDVVIHTAYSMEDLQRDVVDASTRVIEGCLETGAGLIHISTDAVFDGDHPPYAEDDVPQPIHPYGVAKRDVEAVIAQRLPEATIVRTSLIAHLDVDEPDSATGWVVDANREGREVTLFDDEVRTVVRCVDLVSVLVELAELPAEQRRGVWHVAGPEALTRAELGEHIAKVFGLDRGLIRHASSSSVPGPRPRDVSLRADRLARELSVRTAPIAIVPSHGEAQG